MGKDIVPRQFDYMKTIELFAYGYQCCEANHSFGPGVREEYIIHYVHHGKGVYCSNGKKYNVSEGMYFGIFPRTLVHYIANEENPWTYSWICLQGPSMKALFENMGITPDNLMDHADSREETSKTIYDMTNNNGSTLTDAFYRTGKMYEFISSLLKDNEMNLKPSNNRKCYVESVIKYINQNYYNELTVEKIAQYIGLDRSYIGQLFKNEKGLSIKEYLISLRMQKAFNFLIGTDFNISEIGRSVGYQDAFWFSKIFKKKYGMSPDQLRKNYDSSKLYFQK